MSDTGSQRQPSEVAFGAQHLGNHYANAPRPRRLRKRAASRWPGLGVPWAKLTGMRMMMPVPALGLGCRSKGADAAVRHRRACASWASRLSGCEWISSPWIGIALPGQRKSTAKPLLLRVNGEVPGQAAVMWASPRACASKAVRCAPGHVAGEVDVLHAGVACAPAPVRVATRSELGARRSCRSRSEQAAHACSRSVCDSMRRCSATEQASPARSAGARWRPWTSAAAATAHFLYAACECHCTTMPVARAGAKSAAVKKDMVKADNGGSTRAAHAPGSIAAFVGDFAGEFHGAKSRRGPCPRQQSSIRGKHGLTRDQNQGFTKAMSDLLLRRRGCARGRFVEPAAAGTAPCTRHQQYGRWRGRR